MPICSTLNPHIMHPKGSIILLTVSVASTVFSVSMQRLRGLCIYSFTSLLGSPTWPFMMTVAIVGFVWSPRFPLQSFHLGLLWRFFMEPRWSFAFSKQTCHTVDLAVLLLQSLHKFLPDSHFKMLFTTKCIPLYIITSAAAVMCLQPG